MTGTVTARNDALDEQPELINSDPYGDGLDRRDRRRAKRPSSTRCSTPRPTARCARLTTRDAAIARRRSTAGPQLRPHGCPRSTAVHNPSRAHSLVSIDPRLATGLGSAQPRSDDVASTARRPHDRTHRLIDDLQSDVVPDRRVTRVFCTACGTENPPGSHFCANCGAALPARRPAVATAWRRRHPHHLDRHRRAARHRQRAFSTEAHQGAVDALTPGLGAARRQARTERRQPIPARSGRHHGGSPPGQRHLPGRCHRVPPACRVPPRRQRLHRPRRRLAQRHLRQPRTRSTRSPLSGGDEVQIGKFRLVYLTAAVRAGAGARAA